MKRNKINLRRNIYLYKFFTFSKRLVSANEEHSDRVRAIPPTGHVWKIRKGEIICSHNAVTCSRGGHSGGLGIRHVANWSKSECSTPHSSSRHLSYCLLTQTQPHLFSALSNWFSTNLWSRTSKRHKMNADRMSPM